MSRNAPTFLLLFALVFFVAPGVRLLAAEDPQSVDPPIDMRQLEESAARGASSSERSTAALSTAGATFVTFTRLPAEGYAYLRPMDGPADRPTSYFRDAATGGRINAFATHDGETWSAEATRPDGTTRTWGAITFRYSYYGRFYCFVQPNGYALCDSTAAIIDFYDYTQCGPLGTWQMRFFHDNTQFSGSSRK